MENTSPPQGDTPTKQESSPQELYQPEDRAGFYKRANYIPPHLDKESKEYQKKLELPDSLKRANYIPPEAMSGNTTLDPKAEVSPTRPSLKEATVHSDVAPPAKRKRGRPRKSPLPDEK